MPTRIHLADDHLLVRQGLKALLEREGFTAVAEVGNGQEAVRASRERLPGRGRARFWDAATSSSERSYRLWRTPMVFAKVPAITQYPATFGWIFGPTGDGAHIHVKAQMRVTLRGNPDGGTGVKFVVWNAA